MLRFVFSLSIWCAGAVVLQAAPALFCADTVPVASALQSFVLDKGARWQQIPLKAPQKIQLNTTSEYWLVFDELVANQLPEGVYEVHLKASSAFSVQAASVADASFVGLLDLYGLSVADHPTLSFEVTSQIYLMAADGTPIGDALFVTILFRGNTLPSGAEVEHNGHLSLGKTKIVELR